MVVINHYILLFFFFIFHFICAFGKLIRITAALRNTLELFVVIML